MIKFIWASGLRVYEVLKFCYWVNGLPVFRQQDLRGLWLTLEGLMSRMCLTH